MKSKHILPLLVSLLCFSACRDSYYIEHDLHGMWQVTSIEKLDSNQVVEKYDGQLYYLFQRTMVMLGYQHSDESWIVNRYIAHLDFVAPDSVGMGDFRGADGKYEEKISLRNLHKFGIYQDYTTFCVEKRKRSLILTSDNVCIKLRKY